MDMFWYISEDTGLPTWVRIFVSDWAEDFALMLDEEKTTWILATIDY